MRRPDCRLLINNGKTKNKHDDRKTVVIVGGCRMSRLSLFVECRSWQMYQYIHEHLMVGMIGGDWYRDIAARL